jgi:hypothetical protein
MRRLMTLSLALSLLLPAAALAQDTPEIVQRMIEAHGGMKAWRSAATVSFRDSILAAGAPSALVTQVTVHQQTRRSYIDFPGTDMSLTWDGEKAWGMNWKESMPPPRFLALLDFYFACLPWLTQDPGVILTEEGTARLWDDPTEYRTVRMTFGQGVGDTPDDYYILYIHPDTHMLRACEYIVTYQAILPEGMEATPPHILVYEDFETVNWLQVPTRYTTYQVDHSLYARCWIRDWSFKKPFDGSRMRMPEGAEIDTTTP